jgi:hypothetical protein
MRHILLLILLILPVAGCVHTRQADPDATLPPGAPEVGEILSALQAPDRHIENLASNGEIRMRLPGEAGIQRFPQGRVHFQQPAQFFAQGRKGGVVRIYSDGGRFLLELPSEKTFYHGAEGDHFEDIALDIAPSRIFRELFLIDLLDGIAPERVRIESHDQASGQSVLAVYVEGRRRKVERRLVVAPSSEGWTILESQLFDAEERLIGRTICEDYQRLGGILVPTRVTVTFPEHEAEMSFAMSPPSVKINQAAPPAMDDIDAKRAELQAAGFQEINSTTRKAGVE